MAQYWFRKRWGRYYPCSAEGWLVTVAGWIVGMSGLAVLVATNASRGGVIAGLLLIFVPVIPFCIIVLKRAEPRR